ncbi:porin [Cupriavidus pinatubonensis]|uniref:Outer membrane porin protein n=1 Tax=Cupriavidus pinatubonensis TaxID=248026 RepID=A0ABN7ZLJ6_9BURK|nr:porin [Cupriavidus pinatubonensis]CAG9184964.1 Outer membrane porin protein [Cupriavidus pinatubonensis]
MNQKFGMVAAATLIAGNAYAQSSVTLYGVIDTSVRYTTNQPTANGPKSQVALIDGAFNGPRWGLRGTEDLGSGNKALFALESGFNSDTGKLGQQGQLFGRQAWLGLSNNSLGTLKVGRQYGAAYMFLAQVDPINTGNYAEDDWEVFLTGLRFDNTVDYSNQWGGLFVNAQYSLGEQSGNAARGRTMQLAATYDIGGLKLGGAGQQSRDANGKDLMLWTAGAKYTFGQFTLNGYYVDSRRDAGFIVGASGTSAPLANTSIGSNANTVAGLNTQTSQRHDRLGVVGLTYEPAGTAWKFIGTYMRDNVAGAAQGASGIVQTAYFVAMYALSKRTDVYLEADRSRLSGASVTDPNSPLGPFGGASNRTGVGLGMRHRF